MISAWLLVLVPISLALEHVVHASPLWVFVTAVAAIAPLAEWIRKATDHLARRAGSAIGGLLNVTFGNTAELVLALFVLAAGNAAVAKAQITGSIIGNSLLGLGLAVVVGTWGREHRTFNRQRAGLLSSLLILSVIALMLPALFDYMERGLEGAATVSALDETLSLGVAAVLVVVYVANLAYTFVTHRDVFARDDDEGGGDEGGAWPVWLSLLVLAGGTAVTALEAELVAGALEATAEGFGLSTFFLGVIVLAVVGNAAEYVSAVHFAREGRMSLVMSITVGSTIQVALLLAPVLVLVSYAMGSPMNLVFENPVELIAIASVAFIVNAIAQDGEVTWFEGVLLLAVYALFGFAFLLVTP